MTTTATNSGAQTLAQKPQPPSRQDSTDQLLYRAFELALWALPAADSFATREAVKATLAWQAE